MIIRCYDDTKTKAQSSSILFDATTKKHIIFDPLDTRIIMPRSYVKKPDCLNFSCKLDDDHHIFFFSFSFDEPHYNRFKDTTTQNGRQVYYDNAPVCITHRSHHSTTYNNDHDVYRKKNSCQYIKSRIIPPKNLITFCTLMHRHAL